MTTYFRKKVQEEVGLPFAIELEGVHFLIDATPIYKMGSGAFGGDEDWISFDAYLIAKNGVDSKKVEELRQIIDDTLALITDNPDGYAGLSVQQFLLKTTGAKLIPNQYDQHRNDDGNVTLSRENIVAALGKPSTIYPTKPKMKKGP